MMTDLLVGKREKPLVVHGPSETMEAMDKDVFNKSRLAELPRHSDQGEAGHRLRRDPGARAGGVPGLRIRAIPVAPPGLLRRLHLEGSNGAVAFSGDTGPTDELCGAINATPNVKAVFVELSFPNSMQWLADVSGHLTPKTVMSELNKLDRRGAKVYLYHLKPAVIDGSRPR